MTTIIIEDSSPQAKEFVAYACKSAVVQSYPLVLSLHIAKKDWIGIVNKQLIMHHSTQSAKKLFSTEKYAYLRVRYKRRAQLANEAENRKIVNNIVCIRRWTLN